MKYRFLSIAVLFLFSSCKPKYGILTGNVYWKYNNYVGNKPDAGSSIYLYPYKKGSEPLEATADIQGNFRFDKLKTGKYLLIVVSKNTTDSPYDHFLNLRNNAYSLKNVFDFDLSTILPDKQREFRVRDSLLNRFDSEMGYDDTNKFLKNMELSRRKKDTLREIAEEIIRALPDDMVMNLGILTSYGRKFEIKYVKIEKDKISNEVIDFGITYM